MLTKDIEQISPAVYKNIMLNNDFSLIEKVIFLGELNKQACRFNFTTGVNQANSRQSVDEISHSLHAAVNEYRSEIYSGFRRHIINQLLAYECPMKSKISIEVPFNTDTREFDKKGFIDIKLEFYLLSGNNSVEIDGKMYNVSQFDNRLGRLRQYNVLPGVILPLVTLHNCTSTKPKITFKKDVQSRLHSIVIEMRLTTFGLVQFLNPRNTNEVIEDAHETFGKTIQQWQRVITKIGTDNNGVQQTIEYNLDFKNDLTLLYHEKAHSTGNIPFEEQPINYARWVGR